MEDEGHEPAEYVFEISKGTPIKKPASIKDTSDKENETDTSESGTVPAAAVVEPTKPAEEVAKPTELKVVIEKMETIIKQEPTETIEILDDDDDDSQPPKEEAAAEPVEQKAAETPKAVEAAKPAAPVANPVVEAAKSETADNEDSLNLTIGEEEEKLFNEDISSDKKQVGKSSMLRARVESLN